MRCIEIYKLNYYVLPSRNNSPFQSVRTIRSICDPGQRSLPGFDIGRSVAQVLFATARRRNARRDSTMRVNFRMTMWGQRVM